jgi:hypothetical protein
MFIKNNEYQHATATQALDPATVPQLAGNGIA